MSQLRQLAHNAASAKAKPITEGNPFPPESAMIPPESEQKSLPRSDVPDQTYIEALQRLIAELHGCPSQYLETVRVHETFLGRTIWKGEVEVFTVFNHPRTQRCYGWIHGRSRRHKRVRFVALLGTGFIKSAQDAVKFFCVVKSAPLMNEMSRLHQPNGPGPEA